MCGFMCGFLCGGSGKLFPSVITILHLLVLWAVKCVLVSDDCPLVTLTCMLSQTLLEE